MRAEINEIEKINIKTNINYTKSWLLENINNMVKSMVKDGCE